MVVKFIFVWFFFSVIADMTISIWFRSELFFIKIINIFSMYGIVVFVKRFKIIKRFTIDIIFKRFFCFEEYFWCDDSFKFWRSRNGVEVIGRGGVGDR